MKLITYEEMKELNIQPNIWYQLVDDALRHKQDAQLPAKTSLKQGNIFCNIMPCIYQDYGSIKIVNRYPNRIPSLDGILVLYNANNGDFLALMDSNYITTIRTGAVAAHSIKLLAKHDFYNISIMGLGNAARATLLTLLNIFPNRSFHITLLKYHNQENSFIDRFANFSQLTFDIVDNVKDLVHNADVVISGVTYLEEDVCDPDDFKEGVLLLPIHTRGFSNCDLVFDKIFADDYNHVKHFKNFHEFKNFAEVSDVLNGKVPGRTSNQERIIAYNIGIGLHDLSFAIYIYQQLMTQKQLMDFDRKKPTEKFYI